MSSSCGAGEFDACGCPLSSSSSDGVEIGVGTDGDDAGGTGVGGTGVGGTGVGGAGVGGTGVGGTGVGGTGVGGTGVGAGGVRRVVMGDNSAGRSRFFAKNTTPL